MDLQNYDIILINSSGGKDSQTMLREVYNMAVTQDVVGRLVVVHADLGRVEWANTKELAHAQAFYYGLPFEAIARPQGDLLAHVKERRMWPSSTTRYCTSDHKRGQVGKIITALSNSHPHSFYRKIKVLNCMGFRAEESAARAKRKPFETDHRNSNGKRRVDTWLPIFAWTERQVWESIKAARVPHHSAYDLGMPRLSCVFCIFAPKPALVLAGRHNPELLQEYVDLEAEIGHKFRLDTSMAEVQQAVFAGETIGSMDGKWNM